MKTLPQGKMSASEPDPSQYPLTVLVADDSLPELNLLKALFQKRGHRMVEARNGAEALLALASESPDVVGGTQQTCNEPPFLPEGLWSYASSSSRVSKSSSKRP